MDRGASVIAAVGVLVGGLAAAFLFRVDQPRGSPTVPRTGDRLVLRKQIGSPVDAVPPATDLAPAFHSMPAKATAMATAAGTRNGSAGIVEPGIVEPGIVEPGIVEPAVTAQTPPTLAKDYPVAGVPGTACWGTRMTLAAPNRAALIRGGQDRSVRKHKIVDGDTLQSLAARYLASEDDFLDIYESNRDVLPSPWVLPIGVELKIYPRKVEQPTTPQAAPSRQPQPKRPLVPVQPRS